MNTEIVEKCKRHQNRSEEKGSNMGFFGKKEGRFDALMQKNVQNRWLCIVHSHVFGKIDQLIEIID